MFISYLFVQLKHIFFIWYKYLTLKVHFKYPISDILLLSKIQLFEMVHHRNKNEIALSTEIELNQVCLKLFFLRKMTVYHVSVFSYHGLKNGLFVLGIFKELHLLKTCLFWLMCEQLNLMHTNVAHNRVKYRLNYVRYLIVN